MKAHVVQIAKSSLTKVLNMVVMILTVHRAVIAIATLKSGTLYLLNSIKCQMVPMSHYNIKILIQAPVLSDWLLYCKVAELTSKQI